MPEIYLLALVVVLACTLAIFVKRFKLPLVVSYVAAGALLAAFNIVRPEQLKFLAILPEIGLAFLLFLVGMELDLREFKALGKNVLFATLGQVCVTVLVATSVCVLLGLPLVSGILIGLAVAFSSTILVVKLLLEGKELSSIYGKLSIGILLIEDLLAVIVLMFNSVLSTNPTGLSGFTVFLVLIKGIVLLGLSLTAGKKLLPKIFEISADNSELLFLTAIAWCLLFVSLSVFLGFSLAIGAFLAGISLAQSVYRIQITGRIKPLRDFFIMIFFLDLGTGLSLTGLSHTWIIAIVILLYVVILKPLVFFLLFTAFRFRAHSAFQTGVLLSSVSEFSLIMVSTASAQGLLPTSLVSPFIFATVLSFVGSSFMASHSKFVYSRVKGVLKSFEDKEPVSFEALDLAQGTLSSHAILIGCHRSGSVVLPALVKAFDKNLIVVDFNPEVISRLRKEGINCVYGDVADFEVQEKVAFEQAKVVISTVRDLPDNLALLDCLQRIKSQSVVIMTANEVSEALKLYDHGADFVALPLALEGDNISHLIKAYKTDFSELSAEKDKRVEELRKVAGII